MDTNAARAATRAGRRLPRVRAGAVALGVALTAAVAASSCGSTETRPKTLKEILEENSTILRDLGSYQSAVRDDAAQRIKRLGREQGTAVVLHLLTDPKFEDDRVEIILARILADWEDPRAVPYLLQFMSHPDSGARRNASEGLLRFEGLPQVMAALGELLSSVVQTERRIAAETLTRMRSDAALRLCADHVAEEPDAKIRAELLIFVMNSRYDGRIGTMIEALNDSEVAIRSLAWTGLERLPGLPSQVRFSPRMPPRPTDPAAARERERKLRILRLWASGER